MTGAMRARTIPILLGAACALLATPPAAAGDGPWLLAVKLGEASVEVDFGPPIRGWRVDDEDRAAGLEVAYQVHPYLGLQAGYHDLGRYEGLPRPCPPGVLCPLEVASDLPELILFTPVEAEIEAFSLAALPTWPVSDRIALYGKLGVLDWEAEVRRSFDRGLVDRPSDRELLAGVGARYLLPPGLALLVEIEVTDPVDTIWLGAGWRF